MVYLNLISSIESKVITFLEGQFSKILDLFKIFYIHVSNVGELSCLVTCRSNYHFVRCHQKAYGCIHLEPCLVLFAFKKKNNFESKMIAQIKMFENPVTRENNWTLLDGIVKY